jgi:hypothetical protein
MADWARSGLVIANFEYTGQSSESTDGLGRAKEGRKRPALAQSGRFADSNDSGAPAMRHAGRDQLRISPSRIAIRVNSNAL